MNTNHKREFNIVNIFRTVARGRPEQVAIESKTQNLTYGDLDRNTDAIASYLLGCGLGYWKSPSGADPLDIVQPRIGVLAHNTQHHLEVLLGCFKARAVPFNINFRYTAEEIRYLIKDSDASALFVESSLLDLLPEEIVAATSAVKVIPIPELDFGGDEDVARSYRQLISSPAGEIPETGPDDRYLIYTGGTTGFPKGVIWRQEDVVIRPMGCRNIEKNIEYPSLQDMLDDLDRNPTGAQLSAAPMMHGGGQWFSMRCLLRGGTLILPNNPRSFDAADTVERCLSRNVNQLMMIGDAFGIPLIDELEKRKPSDIALKTILTGGVRLTEPVRKRLLELVPGLMIVNAAGASESGTLIMQATRKGDEVMDGCFTPGASARIVSSNYSRFILPGDPEIGWLASVDHIPLGYYRDAKKTDEVLHKVEGVDCICLGDRVQWVSESELRLLGRDALTINTGGEKVFAEEVGAALMEDPRVRDVLVLGTPHDRWGQQVTALIQVSAGAAPDDEGIRQAARAKLAPYKVPRKIVFVPQIERLANGKTDYDWANRIATQESAGRQVMGKFERIRYDKPLEGVARITLARPEAKNAQDKAMIYEINQAYEDAMADDDVRVVVLAADGDDFNSGHDIRDQASINDFESTSSWRDYDRPAAEGYFSYEHEVYLDMCWRWRNLPKPVISQVQGRVIAGGLMLIWATDIIIASEDAVFSDPVVAFNVNGHELFTHAWEFGARKAKELLMTGRPISARAAHRIGMVNHVVPRDQLEDETLELAAEIASQPMFGLKLAKLSVNASLDAQGQYQAVSNAFALHHLAHTHNRVHHEKIVDPAGLERIRKQNKLTPKE
jgi:acyl-CoA synthetase (AMP-forming)/AMP-acid ligase II/enoyl-CoA hydratase/carnithine racemase